MSPPDTMNITIVSSDGVSIPAIYQSARPMKKHSVIMMHGITTHKNEFGGFFCALANILATRGIGSIRFDFRGHGDSLEPSRGFSVASQVVDCLSVLAWLHEREASHAIHILSCSFGSPPAIFASRLAHPNIASISMICPVLDYRRTFLQPETGWARAVFSEERQALAFQKGYLCVTDDFCIDVKLLVEMSLLDPISALHSLHQRVLLIHGDADSMVPFAVSELVARDNERVVFLPYPGMDHGFTVPEDEDGTHPDSLRNIASMGDHIVRHILRNDNG